MKKKVKNQTHKKKGFFLTLKRDIALWLFVLPGLILTFIYSYIPMYGVQLAFRKYNPKLGFSGRQWVGPHHFLRFFYLKCLFHHCRIPDSDYFRSDAEFLPA